jgi:menaquinone-dependent protoporphyrinogen IX oxidase
MKTAVIYWSKSGYVKNYAFWLSDALKADLFNGMDIDYDELEHYDTLIFGGGLYAVGINGVKSMKEAMKKYSDKEIIVFACGASPPRESVKKEVLEKNFSDKERYRMRFYYFRGGFDYDRLSFIDSILMRLMKFNLKRKKDLTPDEKGMLAAYDHPVDFTKKENLSGIVDYVKSCQKNK